MEHQRNCLVFGGNTGPPANVGVTEHWNGTAWTEQNNLVSSKRNTEWVEQDQELQIFVLEELPIQVDLARIYRRVECSIS